MDGLRYLLTCTLLWWLNASSNNAPLRLGVYDSHSREIMKRLLSSIYGSIRGPLVLQVFENRLYKFIEKKALCEPPFNLISHLTENNPFRVEDVNPAEVYGYHLVHAFESSHRLSFQS